MISRSIFLVIALSLTSCQEPPAPVPVSAPAPVTAPLVAPSWPAAAKGLPDFSYAGYQHGEKAIPDIQGPVFKVEDFGAVADDEQPDGPAIQKAIDACAEAKGGVVLFGKGRYLINTDRQATQAPVSIRSSGIVLRGAGCGPGGTVLASPAEMQPANPLQMWTGRSPIVVNGRAALGKSSAAIMASAKLNALSLQLDPKHRFKAGDRIALMKSFKGEAAAKFVAPHPWESKWDGVVFCEYHEITAVDGAEISLAEPLMTPIDAADKWAVKNCNFISDIGVEDLCFQGAWKGDFKHHRSWLDDSGWRGMSWSGVENSWIRRCVFSDMNWPFHLSQSRQVTMEDVRITGHEAHFGIQASKTYGFLALGVKDEAGMHHGPSVQSGACATVFHQCSWSPKGSFDSHANNPYATLHDDNRGGLNLSGVGGAPNNFPHHLHNLVLWNLEVSATPGRKVDFWTVGKSKYPLSFVDVQIFGLHGPGLDKIQFDSSSIDRNEPLGQTLSPRSLWLSQLETRLKKIPPHFSKQ